MGVGATVTAGVGVTGGTATGAAVAAGAEVAVDVGLAATDNGPGVVIAADAVGATVGVLELATADDCGAIVVTTLIRAVAVD
jgi:hypothetical protein